MLPDMTFFHKTMDADKSVDSLLGSYREKNVYRQIFRQKTHVSLPDKL